MSEKEDSGTKRKKEEAPWAHQRSGALGGQHGIDDTLGHLPVGGQLATGDRQKTTGFDQNLVFARDLGRVFSFLTVRV